MKLGMIALVLGAAVTAASAEARADEPRTDVETDHLDAFDDGGPRSFALLTNPASLLFGAVGAEGDVLLGDSAALSLEADGVMAGGSTGAGAAVGVPLFPQGIALHGLYLHPRVFAARAWSGSGHGDAVGVGGTIGWEWTLPVGFTVRTGAGAVVERPVGGDAGAVSSLVGFRPLLDGSVGWAF